LECSCWSWARRWSGDMKIHLELRPVQHRREERIRAHVLLCSLALLPIRVAATHDPTRTWRRIREQLQTRHLGEFTGKAGTVHQRTELTTDQRDIISRQQLPEPARFPTAGPRDQLSNDRDPARPVGTTRKRSCPDHPKTTNPLLNTEFSCQAPLTFGLAGPETSGANPRPLEAGPRRRALRTPASGPRTTHQTDRRLARRPAASQRRRRRHRSRTRLHDVTWRARGRLNHCHLQHARSTTPRSTVPSRILRPHPRPPLRTATRGTRRGSRRSPSRQP